MACKLNVENVKIKLGSLLVWVWAKIQILIHQKSQFSANYNIGDDNECSFPKCGCYQGGIIKCQRLNACNGN